MGGSFQISSFLVESLWALQCLQNTLLLSVNFSSFEKSLRQSWQREEISKMSKMRENFEEKHRVADGHKRRVTRVVPIKGF